MTPRLLILSGLAAAMALAGCDRIDAAYAAFNDPPKAVEPVDATPVTPPAPTPTGPVQPLKPTGRGLPVKALPEPMLQISASVTEVAPLALQGERTVKLFGTAGGDPAMNGLYTYIAFFRSPADGWWVFQLGDFLSFTVLNEVPGQVDVEVEESVLDPDTGTIGSRKRRIIIAFPVDQGTDAPPNVRFMPVA
jgi:hypothetical protein